MWCRNCYACAPCPEIDWYGRDHYQPTANSDGTHGTFGTPRQASGRIIFAWTIKWTTDHPFSRGQPCIPSVSVGFLRSTAFLSSSLGIFERFSCTYYYYLHVASFGVFTCYKLRGSCILFEVWRTLPSHMDVTIRLRWRCVDGGQVIIRQTRRKLGIELLRTGFCRLAEDSENRTTDPERIIRCGWSNRWCFGREGPLETCSFLPKENYIEISTRTGSDGCQQLPSVSQKRWRESHLYLSNLYVYLHVYIALSHAAY